MKRIILPLLAIIGLSATSAYAQVSSLVPARIVSNHDGDTITVIANNRQFNVRLICIDSPELSQSYGTNSRDRLRQILPSNQTIQLRVTGRDGYGRTLAEVYLNNQSVNLQMVAEGQAVVYRQYLSSCSVTQAQYLAAEGNAQRSRLGVWNVAGFVMPWEWRRNNG